MMQRCGGGGGGSSGSGSGSGRNLSEPSSSGDIPY